MTHTCWGIIGPGAIAHNFADGLKEAPSGTLLAIAGRDENRRNRFGESYGIDPSKRYTDHQQLCSDPDVDAVYISTPHPFHAELAIAAMRAGKPVLCEKPAGVTAEQVRAITEIAGQQGVFFMEALMYRCHPQIARVIDIIRSGEIGEVRHISSAFGFAAPFDPASRLYDRTLAGGAILDVGTYPMSFARLVAGAAMGERFANPDRLKAVGHLGASNVDESAHALLHFEGGITAECATAINRAMHNTARIIGSNGQILLPDPWMPGRDAGPSDARLDITVGGQTRIEQIERPEHLFAFEAEIASEAVAAGLAEAPAPAANWQDSLGNAEALDLWRHEIGYDFTAADRAVSRVIRGVLPADHPAIPTRNVSAIGRPVSSLIMGCDNKNSFADGAILWDAFMEAGGNAFDTAFVYGAGRHEKALGEWIAARGVAADVVVTAKGAHSPYCTPRTIGSELAMSLDRLGLETVPIYIMHRDNLDVPVGEFVDALNRLRDAGRIGMFGGSNWSVERFEEANAYAAKHSLEPMRILNNNLSLAVMERPVWDGCVTSNSPATLAYLRSREIMHLSWSSQARGYFLPAHLRDRLPAETGPEQCFGSEANAERRRRAETIAQECGVSTHNVATAWVLAQSFPSFALIGPRSAGELASTLPAFNFELTQADVTWLNLESDER
ncbi:MAG: aldo/keto reductase [Alphaproteobacteria bacterium]|nr:aldo/keto reductase [Alphaproteobacteria bacterium]